jgi:CRISPR/Cas system endoribonuclease Cas6 (RAMP superfamily)
MIFYPYDYGMMRMDCERRAKLIQQKVNYDADRAYARHLLSRPIRWFRRRLVLLGDRLSVQSNARSDQTRMSRH